VKIIKPIILSVLLLPVCVAAAAEESVPRALILADSIYREPARSAANELKGRVDLVFPKERPGDTTTALTHLDQLLGEGTWQVIHFNFGFADLHYRDPSTNTIRAMSKLAGGIRVTSPEQYEKNLRELVTRLKATGARLIWASTTPIASSKYDNLYDPGSEIEYNAIAARVMAEHKVPINDMHAWVLANVKDKRDPSPFSFNRVPIHPPMVDSILRELGLSSSADAGQPADPNPASQPGAPAADK
jgi:hypothetical protein